MFGYIVPKRLLNLYFLLGFRVQYRYKGVQHTIDIDQVSVTEQTDPVLHLEIPGETDKTLNVPDRDVMSLVDAMLGQTSCLNAPSLCAYRCFYDPDEDMCGPAPFCKAVAENEAPGVLAPFGAQQKCKAVGGSSHEAADEAILSESITTLKTMALDVALQHSERSLSVLEPHVSCLSYSFF